MKPLFVIILSSLLAITVLELLPELTLFASGLWMLTLVLYENQLGKRNFIVLFNIYTGYEILTNQYLLAWVMTMPNIYSLTILILIAVTACLMLNLLELLIVRYVVKRLRLKERCGTIHT